MPTPTPLTDKATCINPTSPHKKIYAKKVDADFVRELERKLVESQAQCAAMREAMIHFRSVCRPRSGLQPGSVDFQTFTVKGGDVEALMEVAL